MDTWYAGSAMVFDAFVGDMETWVFGGAYEESEQQAVSLSVVDRVPKRIQLVPV